jgi:single-strand DNA-binding protein
MNKFLGIGRLVKDPTVKEGNSKVARYTLAIDRYVKDGEKQADFISCVAFGSNADLAQKYLTKGTKIAVEGRVQTGSYEKNGTKVFTTDIIVDRIEFCESKNATKVVDVGDNAPDFLDIPDNGALEDALPFK